MLRDFSAFNAKDFELTKEKIVIEVLIFYHMYQILTFFAVQMHFPRD